MKTKRTAVDVLNDRLSLSVKFITLVLVSAFVFFLVGAMIGSTLLMTITNRVNFTDNHHFWKEIAHANLVGWGAVTVVIGIPFLLYSAMYYVAHQIDLRRARDNDLV